jgi:hypothetical protein
LIVADLSPDNIARCANVMVTPEDNKITVFNRGKPQALIVTIPTGGQTQPIPELGDRVQWKKAQKKLKKNMTSDAINRHIPKRIPCCTFWVWFPSKVASTTISENQRNK